MWIWRTTISPTAQPCSLLVKVFRIRSFGYVICMDCFHPEHLVTVFRTLQNAGWDAILIGGQAVNLWPATTNWIVPTGHLFVPIPAAILTIMVALPTHDSQCGYSARRAN